MAEEGRDDQPEDGDGQQDGAVDGVLAVELLRAVLEAARQDGYPQHEQQVADDRAGDGGLDQLEQAALDGEQGDDQLGCVAEGGVDQPADLGAGVRGQPLGAVADQPGQRDNAQGGQAEDQERIPI